MVPVFEITVKARPATINFARFKLHLRAREETLLASARFTTWERRVFFGSAVATPPKGFGGAAFSRYGLEAAMGAAFDIPARRPLKKLNESYAAIGKVSR